MSLRNFRNLQAKSWMIMPHDGISLENFEEKSVEKILKTRNPKFRAEIWVKLSILG